ncbi:MAG: hypothetical protein EXQ95_15395 [Alphaproteobacteria bacterium]|nr:hypothetical protein [Alphaproteobacteria bacterium]
MGSTRQRSVGSWAGLGLALLALTGCARLGMSTASTAKAPDGPMAPSLALGDVFTFEDTGVQVQEQVTGFAGPRAIWQNDRGVSWVQAADVISPPVSWSGDPRLGPGTQQVFGDPAKLFPLEPGKTVKFQVAGMAEKLPDGWQAENTCTAVGKEPVKVKAGEFQAWRIACQRGEVLETIFYVPEIMTYALRTRERAKEPPYERKELVAFDLARAPDRKLSNMAMATDVATAHDHAQNNQAMAAQPETTNRIARLEAQVAQLERMAMQQPAAGQPRPTATRPTTGAAPAAEPKPAMASAGAGRFGAHLGSYRTVNEAKQGWETLARANPDVLGTLGYQTAEFDPGDGRGIFIRLLAGPFDDRTKVQNLCRDLQGKRVFCRVLSLGPA